MTDEKQVTKVKEVKNVSSELSRIQGVIKIAKEKVNAHGNFKYRTAEDILSVYKAVKEDTYILCVPEIVIEPSEKRIMKVTAQIWYKNECIGVPGFATLPDELPRMNAPQTTGACESYAKKYALQNLFAIDDGEMDIDKEDKELSESEKKDIVELELHESNIQMIDDISTLQKYWEENKDNKLGKRFAQMVTSRKMRIQKDMKNVQ